MLKRLLVVPFIAVVGGYLPADAAAESLESRWRNAKEEAEQSRQQDAVEQGRREHESRLKEERLLEEEQQREAGERRHAEHQAQQHRAQQRRLAREQARLDIQQRQLARQRQKLAVRQQQAQQLRQVQQLATQDEHEAVQRQGFLRDKQRTAGRSQIESQRTYQERSRNARAGDGSMDPPGNAGPPSQGLYR